jgi:hypothetical protein
MFRPSREARALALRVVPRQFEVDTDAFARAAVFGADYAREWVRGEALWSVRGRATTEAEARALRIWANEYANELVPWQAARG